MPLVKISHERRRNPHQPKRGRIDLAGEKKGNQKCECRRKGHLLHTRRLGWCIGYAFLVVSFRPVCIYYLLVYQTLLRMASTVCMALYGACSAVHTIEPYVSAYVEKHSAGKRTSCFKIQE